MAVLTTEKLGETVGAEVIGVDPERLATDADLPGAVLEALEENGALVFRDLHLDDAAQVAFSKQLGSVETFRDADPPEIFRVTLDPAKNPAAQYLRGTFDWHIDGCTDDIPIKATILSAHAVAGSGGETEFASSYEAYDLLDDDEKAHVESLRVVHTIEASQRLFNNEPDRGAAGAVAVPPGQGAPAGVAPRRRPQVAGDRRHRLPHRRHGPRREQGPARRPARAVDARPSASTATSGRWATW